MLSRRSLFAAAPLLLSAIPGAHAARRAPGHGPAPRAPLPLVVLDPGHGGKDPGAIGVTGTYEKHVAFAAAQELRDQLRRSGRYRVEVTRARDTFIRLEDRVGFAQARGAALFVSMHADAVADHGVRGASIYTVSDTASDSQTAALAVRENSADRFAPGQFRGYDPAIANILASLVRQETRAGSARMSRQVVNALGTDVKLLSNPARHAQFAVLKAADIPSVLLEMGFMSNPLDEAALRRADHRARIATAMREAVDGFFSGTGGNPRA